MIRDMTEVAHFEQAVYSWREGNCNYKSFAEHAAQVDGRETLKLANACSLSCDSVESYRNAYRLYREILTAEEDPRVVEMWEQANISIWIAASKRRKQHKLSVVWDYIETAVTEGMKVEAFRTELDKLNSKTAEWEVRLKRIVNSLWKLKTDYKSIGFPVDKRARFEAAVKQFETELQAIAEDTE